MFWDLTKTPQYTNAFQIFRGENNKKPKVTTNSQCEYLFYKVKSFKTEYNHVVCYASASYDEGEFMKLYSIVWNSHAMVWNLNAMLWYGIYCKNMLELYWLYPWVRG